MVGLIAILLFVMSIRLMSAVRQMAPAGATPEEKKRSRSYRLVNVLQVAAMLIAFLVLNLIYHQEYILPSWAFIVRLHFFALVSILHRAFYSIVGITMCLLVLLTALLQAPAPPPMDYVLTTLINTCCSLRNDRPRPGHPGASAPGSAGNQAHISQCLSISAL